MSYSPLSHKLTLLLLIAGGLLTAYLPIVPQGFWTQFAVATQTALGGIVSLIKTSHEPPTKDVPKLPTIGLVLLALAIGGCAGQELTPAQQKAVNELCSPEFRALNRASHESAQAACPDMRCRVAERMAYEASVFSMDRTCAEHAS